ncbi:hypothetical protein ABA45_05115 [Marinobacter psychrophilus]|jgi:hypothetical protein|uniref:Uncharacterized protein n=1 Tax=Marinobacter psychrophilus TaxID=330734 RepID=A0A0H4HYX6_9GAMM|nr:hypothetical protein [Marinobacter psychrophilus]AKO51874.1 hypothetical protein ABA45_05115 [Marinobacter psychrophilus]
MSPSFFEIIQLSNGDYALRRVDDDGAPLVRISFSEEAKDMMDDRQMQVAKAMIAAGIDAAGDSAQDLDEDITDSGSDAEWFDAPHSPTLH